MEKPFLLAPMAEISHRALRELIEQFGGCDEYYTEMISASALLAGGPFEVWYMDNGPVPEKLVYQIVGSDTQHIVKAAAILDRLDCAGIDINMGCSAPLIRKTGAGVAWMASIDKAGELVKQLRKTVKRRLSVKLRIGYNDDFDNLLNFCRHLEAEGVELIILHPRTASEKFKRRARWDYVGRLKQQLGIPVGGNGDIMTAEDLLYRESLKIPDCDSGFSDMVMVGRAAIRQPWIFAAARRLQQGAQALEYNIEETGLQFLELLSRFQPPEFHISRARRFFAYFCDNLKWGNYLKNLLNREQTLSGIEKVWRNYFSGEGEAEKFH